MKKTIGILAHVDAGKTTFSEQVLYLSHAIRSAGRVDHKDAFLDSHPIERERGITVFSDQAIIRRGEDTWYWVDTPGHVDFSPEMERSISVMDYAVIILSCVEGIQSHTETVWTLLKEAHIPVFFFLNKTDRTGADPKALLTKLQKRFSADAVSFDTDPSEEIAARDDALTELFLDGKATEEDITHVGRRLIKERKLFPVFSGSALKNEGVEAFLSALERFTETDYDESKPFSALVYKIRHDAQGARQTFVKVLSGSIAVRDELPCGKVSAIRLYHGGKFTQTDRVCAGDLCALCGISDVMPGDKLGEDGRVRFRTEPMLVASILADKSIPRSKLLEQLKILEAEEPSLVLEISGDDINIHVMGIIQLEVLKELMRERFGTAIDFGPCRVSLCETIKAPSLGIGHYEPLRHYAEVHLLLEKGAPGSGITFESRCHVDDLELHWQRLIETHVFERRHPGVLTGAPITDIHVVLLSGRAHLKHTEGGDFRESTYRAIQNGLLYAECELLEPICRFTIRIPEDNLGSVTAALLKLKTELQPPVSEDGDFVLEGTGRMAVLADFPKQLAELSHGRGHISWQKDHYAPCLNAEEIIKEKNYRNYGSGDSVFCAKGAGYNVAWNKVRDTAHIPWKEELPQNQQI